MVEFRPFNEDTFEDACKVVSEVFSPSACDVIRYGIENPALKEVPNADSGDVAYIDGKPVAFEGSYLRRMYYGKTPFWTICGSTLCVIPEARKTNVAMQLFARHVASRHGSCLVFGNSSNRSSVDMHRFFRIQGTGPKSWEESRVVIVNPICRYVNAIKRRLGMKRSLNQTWSALQASGIATSQNYEVRIFHEINAEFDALWRKYLDSNKGYVLSRSSAELRWAFERRLVSGRGLIIGLYFEGEFIGYAVLKCNAAGVEWEIADLLVIDNDLKLLENLLKMTLELLKNCTPAVSCAVLGFSSKVKPIINRLFPLGRTMPCNSFTWNFQKCSPYHPSMDELDSSESWFFSPYDGDWCLV